MNRHKYPSTAHLPWSPGATDSDIFLAPSVFEGEEVVMTEKMDGENCNMYRDHIHARSLDSRHHPSRDWIKNFHAKIKYRIPEGWRICGENLYAEHSIRYEELPSYFMAFSIWNEENEALSWDETVEWCEELGIEHVPVLWRGEYDLETIREVEEGLDLDQQEGYVLRTSEGFSYDEFQSSLGKWVRPNHVQTDEHWMHQEVTPNGLADD